MPTSRQGSEPCTITGSPEQLAAYLKAEGEKWSRVIRDAKIKAE